MSESARAQVTVNLGFTVVKSVSLLLSLRLADAFLTAQTMGLLLLFRRQGVLWANLVQMGFSQSLQRYYIACDSENKRRLLWGRLVRWVAVIGAATILASFWFGDAISGLLFGSDIAMLGGVFGIYVGGMALGFLAGSSWLAEFRFIPFNVLDWLNGSLIFMACVGIGYGLSTLALATLMSLLTAVSSMVFLCWFASSKQTLSSLFNNDWHLSNNVALYGFSRAMTAFADLATVVIGPWLLRAEPEQAGYLIVAYSALRIMQSLALPIGQVFALRANSVLHDSQKEQNRVFGSVVVVFLIACFGVFFYFLLGHDLLALWLPRSASSVEPILDRLIFFMPALCLFYALRNYVELRYESPLNLYTLLAGLGVFMLVAFAAGPVTVDTTVIASAAMFTVFYGYGIVFLAILWRARRLDRR